MKQLVLIGKKETLQHILSKLEQVSVGQLVGQQLIMDSTARASLGLSFVQPEPDDGTIVLFTDASLCSLVGDRWD